MILLFITFTTVVSIDSTILILSVCAAIGVMERNMFKKRIRNKQFEKQSLFFERAAADLVFENSTIAGFIIYKRT